MLLAYLKTRLSPHIAQDRSWYVNLQEPDGPSHQSTGLNIPVAKLLYVCYGTLYSMEKGRILVCISMGRRRQ